MKFVRHFTSSDFPIEQQIKWKICESKITKSNGTVIFHMENIEVPNHWSQQAVNILAQKYFRKAGVPDRTQSFKEDNIPHWLWKRGPMLDTNFSSETSAKQVFHRLASTWTYWGWKEGIFERTREIEPLVYENPEKNAHIFYDEIYFMLAHQFAAPNSPQWFNTGLFWAYGITGDANGQWAINNDGAAYETTNSYENPQPHACFIQPISDNLIEDGGIFDLLKKEARLFKHGSGTGTNFSNLRGKSEKLSGGGISSGLMSFLKIFDTAAGSISSGGVTRRAAKMVCLNLDHPEIEDFIDWKMNEEAKAASLYVGSKYIDRIGKGLLSDSPDDIPRAIIDRHNNGFETKIYDLNFEGEAINTVSAQNANNSIRITYAFLHMVDSNGDWALINRKDGSLNKKIKARDLWDKITRAAWACGDPGLLFDDTINEWHTCKSDGRINACNPCGEYQFLDNTACNLASLNLGKFLKGSVFQIKDFEHATRLWTIVLEISVYMASFPSREIAENSYAYRTLGLGYANLGGMLMRLGLGYDSDEGRNWASSITALMHGVAYETSQEMAKELGPFSRWENNKESMLDVIEKHQSAMNNLCLPHQLKDEDIWKHYRNLTNTYNPGFRNAQVSLIAPTGTISLLMDCDTSGIEPDFSLIKYKNLSGGGVMQIVNECVPEALTTLGYTGVQIHTMIQHIDAYGNLEEYTINGQYLPEEHLKVFDCANPSGTGTRFLRPLSHVLMMAAVQPFLSGAISKTCNLPNSATIEDVDFIYREAHRLNLKAIAIYRDGSKLTQPLSSKKEIDPVTSYELRMEERGLIKTTGGPTLESIQEAMFTMHKPILKNGSSAKQLPQSSRRQLPNRRKGYTQKIRIDGQSVYLRTGEYEDGKLGEIWSEISREGSSVRALLGGFCKLASISLQFGVPLEQLVKSFVYTKFEPAGIVQDHDKIKMTTSIFDFIFRELAIHYLNQNEYANVNPENNETPIFLDLDSFKSPLPLHEKTLETEITYSDKDLESRAMNWVAQGPVPRRTKGEWLKETEDSVSIFYPPESEESYIKGLKIYEKLRQKSKSLNFTGNSCPNCGHNTLKQIGTCVECTTCFQNTGCG